MNVSNHFWHFFLRNCLWIFCYLKCASIGSATVNYSNNRIPHRISIDSWLIVSIFSITIYWFQLGKVSKILWSIDAFVIWLLETTESRLQWCWRQHYVDDFMLATDLRCWWQKHYVGEIALYHTCHQHILSPTSVTNIEVALSHELASFIIENLSSCK